MNRIHVLSEHIANKIAAGEVVERPASVVKELVENALDAGATQIDVEIRGGGRGLIQVSDNGIGMSRDDARLAFARHATSKIKDVDDIYKIETLGFRGEALPSIAAVARVELTTSEKGAKEGTRLKLEAGKVLACETAPPAEGTKISVADLFFNTPARLKFLKGEGTEKNQILSTVTLASLAQPKVGFRLAETGKTILDIPRGSELPERLRLLFGKEFAQEMVPVFLERGGKELKVSGMIGKPSLNRANRLSQYFFVNARPIQSRNLSFSLSQGFDTLMMVNRFPVGVIFVEVDPSLVDVNIHPTKKEVKFSDEGQVRELLVRAVKSALAETNFTRGPKKIEREWSRESVSIDPGTFASRLQEGIGAYAAQEELPQTAGQTEPWEAKEPAAAPTPQLIRVLGAVKDTYLVCETTAGLLLIDQHAAHERLLFEQVLLDFEKGKVETQQLLMPEVVELTAAEAALLEPYVAQLNKVGVSVSSFGATSFLVDALPTYFKNASVSQMLREMVGKIESWGKVSAPEKAREKLAAMVSCKAAVKAHDRLKPEEMNRLAGQAVLSLQNKTCPHGRPIMIQMSEDDLAREFKRK